MTSREKEIAEIAAVLDDLLDQLEDSVAALNAILAEPPPGDEPAGRVAAQ